MCLTLSEPRSLSYRDYSIDMSIQQYISHMSSQQYQNDVIEVVLVFSLLTLNMYQIILTQFFNVFIRMVGSNNFFSNENKVNSNKISTF